jgi:hypothetical protein
MDERKETPIPLTFVEASMIMQALVAATIKEKKESDDRRLIGAYKSIFDKLKGAFKVPLEFPAN